ncbi:MAG TPA: hypothetical protein H9883_06805 [Candidatus Ruthenibacterium merdigallinarum]|nr:hypothetical protein [Candidatus Ruthenibacterium merdigallinarum]
MDERERNARLRSAPQRPADGAQNGYGASGGQAASGAGGQASRTGQRAHGGRVDYGQTAQTRAGRSSSAGRVDYGQTAQARTVRSGSAGRVDYGQTAQTRAGRSSCAGRVDYGQTAQTRTGGYASGQRAQDGRAYGQSAYAGQTGAGRAYDRSASPRSAQGGADYGQTAPSRAEQSGCASRQSASGGPAGRAGYSQTAQTSRTGGYVSGQSDYSQRTGQNDDSRAAQPRAGQNAYSQTAQMRSAQDGRAYGQTPRSAQGRAARGQSASGGPAGRAGYGQSAQTRAGQGGYSQAPRSARGAGGPYAAPGAGGTERRRPGAPRRKKGFSMPTGGAFFACAFAVILLLSGVITAVIEAPGMLAAAGSTSASAAADSAAQSGGQAASDGQNGEAAGAQLGPVRQDTLVMQPITAALMAQPENGRVDMSYFDDALFVGDSLTQGFLTYTANGFENASFAAYIGASPRTFINGTAQNAAGETVRPMDEILAANAKKVYILLGTNALETSTDEAFLKYYGDFLDLLLEQLPADTVFYLQSIPPASAEKAAADEKFALSRIQSVNDGIAQLAYSRGMHYVDLTAALSDETGALRADYAAGDGLHMNAQGYGAWREVLITHTVHSADNPYLPGSPYYKAPAA